MACLVAQRTNEFGIRLALGAQRRDVLLLVLRQGGVLIGAGVALGLAITFASTRAIESLLYNTGQHDPLTLGFTALLLASLRRAGVLVARPPRCATNSRRC